MLPRNNIIDAMKYLSILVRLHVLLAISFLTPTIWAQESDISFARSTKSTNDFDDVELVYTASADQKGKSLLFVRANNTSELENFQIGISSTHFCSGITVSDWVFYRDNEVIYKADNLSMIRKNSETVYVANWKRMIANTWSLSDPGEYWVDLGNNGKLKQFLLNSDEVRIRVSNQYCDTDVFEFNLSQDKTGLTEVLQYDNDHPVRPELTSRESVQKAGGGFGEFILFLGGLIGLLAILGDA
jgi:hypothetical protein